MSASKTLTEAEAEALFNGTLRPLRAAETPGKAERDYVARYDRCSSCRAMTPALFTFTGTTDWSPVVALDSPVRAAIAHLRVTSGRRTILLCSPCLDELSEAPAATVAVESSSRLFEP